MWCDTLEIDDELFAAQDERRLVVFAGAGISMASPSNLPSFLQLATRIGGGSLQPDSYPETALDIILGRMEFRGVDVHERCRRIIADPASQPNALHTSILRLFRNPDDIRVITTNFDKHFSTSATALHLPVPEFHAPALPLGYDFTGIIHLHGSIDEAARMVLTDGNFGAAYMSDGWVTRFLRDLFATYTVVFIGYSHSDPPMNYFNLGLGGRRRRHFILTSEDLPQQWRRLHLTPLLYQTEANGADHSRLARAVQNWADQTALRPRDVAARLQQILANPTVLSPSDETFLLRHYNREHSIGAFVEHAQLFDWVAWMHRKGLVRPLLIEKDANGTLAFWLGRAMARDGTGIGFAIVDDCGGTLSFNAARGLLIEILRSLETTAPTLAQKHWLLLLLRQSPNTYLGVYARVISLLQRYDGWATALQVLAFLITPSIRLASDNRPHEHFVGTGPFPTITGEHYDLTETFQAITVLAGSNAHRQLQLLRALEKGCSLLGEQCEVLGLNNHHRPGLVSFESILTADRYGSDAMGALIGFTCQFALDLATAGKLDRVTFERWLDSKNQILIRGALLCMEQSQLSASEIWEILLHHNGIYPLAFMAEMERDALIHTIYPNLSQNEKQALWQAINQGPPPEWEEGAPNE